MQTRKVLSLHTQICLVENGFSKTQCGKFVPLGQDINLAISMSSIYLLLNLTNLTYAISKLSSKKPEYD